MVFLGLLTASFEKHIAQFILQIYNQPGIDLEGNLQFDSDNIKALDFSLT